MKLLLINIIFAISTCNYYEDRIKIIWRIDEKYVVGVGDDNKEKCLFYNPSWYLHFDDSIPDVPRYEPFYCIVKNPKKYRRVGDSIIYVWGATEYLKMQIYNTGNYRKVRTKAVYYKDSTKFETENNLNLMDSSIIYLP